MYGSGGGGSDGSATLPGRAGLPAAPRLVPDPNLELRPGPGAGPRLRASSPLEQAGPLLDWLSPRHNYSDISTVQGPGSAERSLPSTLLTNPLSSLSSGLTPDRTPGLTDSSRSRSGRLTSSQLGTIPEDGSLHSRVSVQADIHQQGVPDWGAGATPRSGRGWGGLPGLYSLAPPPAPVHRVRALSPSRQYPPAPHIAPPRIPDITARLDPREAGAAQRIAQLDLENAAASSQRPLATSSPPGGRKTSAPAELEDSKPRLLTPDSRVVTFDTLNLSGSRAVTGRAGRTGRAGVLRAGKDPGRDTDTVSVVSEGLDAEVTAITSSSSPGSSGSNTLQTGERVGSKDSSGGAADRTSSSSGIASKNPSSADSSRLLRIEDTMAVLYENWPPRPAQYRVSPARAQEAQFLSYHLTTGPGPGLPSFSPHPPPPPSVRPRRLPHSSPDSSLESPHSPVSPPSRAASRPNSSQSAPLDRSVDRHYEWDRATVDDSAPLSALPAEWTVRARRSPHYNPRRDRDIGRMVSAAHRDRVFSDSEIYSNVFPRNRLQSGHTDVEARVRAMKKEFKEFRKTQNVSPNDSDRLESLI